MPIVLSGDYWIFIVSIFVICLFVTRKAIVFAYAGLVLTTAIIYMHYGSGRAVLHLFIIFSASYGLRNLSQKFAKESIAEDN